MAEQTITLASTTSTQNSGLYDYILPIFTAETGINVRVVAVGTGQALRIARNGDADVLLVHHRASEDAFVAEGYGTKRYDVMYNDFVVIGPASDPANVTTAAATREAFGRIYDTKSKFVSRGDDSGTHKREQEIWASAEVAPAGVWYREIGAGMGAALNMSSSINAYTLSDRGTWLSFGNKGELEIVFSGHKDLQNPYGLIPVNPERHPHVDVKSAQRFVHWMTSKKGQEAIGAFRIEGMQLFCPALIEFEAVCPAG